MSFKILIGKRPKSLIFSSKGPTREAPAGLPQFVLPIYSLKAWDLRAFACAVSFSWNTLLVPCLFYSISPLSGHTVVQACARYKVRFPTFSSITLSRSFLSRQDTRSWFPLHVHAATHSRVSHSPRRPMPRPLRTPALLTCRCEGSSNRTDQGMSVLVGSHPRG